MNILETYHAVCAWSTKYTSKQAAKDACTSHARPIYHFYPSKSIESTIEASYYHWHMCTGNYDSVVNYWFPPNLRWIHWHSNYDLLLFNHVSLMHMYFFLLIIGAVTTLSSPVLYLNRIISQGNLIWIVTDRGTLGIIHHRLGWHIHWLRIHHWIISRLNSRVGILLGNILIRVRLWGLGISWNVLYNWLLGRDWHLVLRINIINRGEFMRL